MSFGIPICDVCGDSGNLIDGVHPRCWRSRYIAAQVRVERLESTLADRDAALARVEAERTGAIGQRDLLSQKCYEHTQEILRLQAERDAMRADHGALLAERDSLATTAEHLRMQRDSAESQIEHIKADRDRLESELAASAMRALHYAAENIRMQAVVDAAEEAQKTNWSDETSIAEGVRAVSRLGYVLAAYRSTRLPPEGR